MKAMQWLGGLTDMVRLTPIGMGTVTVVSVKWEQSARRKIRQSKLRNATSIMG